MNKWQPYSDQTPSVVWRNEDYNVTCLWCTACDAQWASHRHYDVEDRWAWARRHRRHNNEQLHMAWLMVWW